MYKKPFELLNEHVDVSCETFERLSLYHDLLLKWQMKINLIGRDTIPDAWTRHFLDSLQLIKYLDDKEKIIADLGSGAGFPGMVLAIYGYKNIHLIESDKRKILFLREVSRIVSAEPYFHNCRIENIDIEKIDVFISRACASLNDLLQLIAFKVSRETICLFHKGKNYSKECDEARMNWQYDMSVYPSISNPESVILKLSNISKR